jgi:hypothetical protein
MVDPEPAAVNVGEEATTTSTTNILLSPESQFRNINQRLNNLSEQVRRIASPPTFRVADVVNLLVIVIGLVIAGFTAFGLSERITDLNGSLAEAERRVTAAINGTELRLQSKLDKLSDQFISMDERTSSLEGGKSPDRPSDASPRVTKPNLN